MTTPTNYINVIPGVLTKHAHCAVGGRRIEAEMSRTVVTTETEYTDDGQLAKKTVTETIDGILVSAYTTTYHTCPAKSQSEST